MGIFNGPAEQRGIKNIIRYADGSAPAFVFFCAFLFFLLLFFFFFLGIVLFFFWAFCRRRLSP